MTGSNKFLVATQVEHHQPCTERSVLCRDNTSSNVVALARAVAIDIFTITTTTACDDEAVMKQHGSKTLSIGLRRDVRVLHDQGK